jgi:hypothetical protein
MTAAVRWIALAVVALAIGVVLAMMLRSSAAAQAAEVATPAAAIADPVSEPAEAIRDVRDALKVGWVAGLVAVVVLACKLAGRLAGRVSWLAKGWRPVVLGVVATVAGGVYDVAMLGGTGTAMLLAALVNLAHAIPHKGPPAPVPS